MSCQTVRHSSVLLQPTLLSMTVSRQRRTLPDVLSKRENEARSSPFNVVTRRSALGIGLIRKRTDSRIVVGFDRGIKKVSRNYKLRLQDETQQRFVISRR